MDDEYGFKLYDTTNLKSKNDQNANNYRSMPEHERVFRRLHIYAGSSNREERDICVFDYETKKLCLKKITTPKALERMFVEIISNATDSFKKARLSGINTGKIYINMNEEMFSIESEGLPIPLEPHPEMCQFGQFGTPVDLIFGVVGSGSNLNDEYERTSGGVNGVGAKLVNIHSRYFEVEAGDNIRGVHQKVIWTKNMTNKVSSICTPSYILKDNNYILKYYLFIDISKLNSEI